MFELPVGTVVLISSDTVVSGSLRNYFRSAIWCSVIQQNSFTKMIATKGETLLFYQEISFQMSSRVSCNAIHLTDIVSRNLSGFRITTHYWQRQKWFGLGLCRCISLRLARCRGSRDRTLYADRIETAEWRS